MQAHAVATPAPVNHAALHLSKALQKPPEFDGKDRKACTTFLSHLNLYINGSPSLFPNDAAKITFAASYLRGRAFSWFEPYLLQPESLVTTNWQTFTTELVNHLGDPDRLGTITRELQTLRQTSSASDYSSRFYQLSSHLSWNDDALRDQFYTGLKATVKDALAMTSADYTTLKELSDVAIKIDNRLYQRKLESKDTRSPPAAPTRASTTFSRPSGNNVSPGPAPMDLDGTKSKKFKPLTQEERARRIRENLCIYCGGSGHRVLNCPLKGQRINAAISQDSSIEFDQPKN